MSTQSGITVKTGDNEFKHVYNHCDGDLHGAGKTLFNHFNSDEKAKTLIEFGNISLFRPYIHPDPDKPHGFFDFDHGKDQADTCRFYKRDRGDEGEEADVLTSIDEAPNYEYNYYFDGKKWKFRTENQKTWKVLSTVLRKQQIINQLN